MRNVFTEKVSEIAMGVSDDKRLQTFDCVISHPFGTGVGRNCRAEFIDYVRMQN